MSHECFTIASAMAMLSRSAAIGATMVNPVTRNIGTIAASLASLDFLSGGRAYLILARGDGAVRNVGSPPATVENTRTFFLALRDLLKHGETTYQDKHIVLRGSLRSYGRSMPLGLVAEGPRMLRMAGEIADLVQIGSGLTPEVIRDSIERVHAGARAAGREPSEIDIWWGTRFHVAPTRQEAVEGSIVSLASIGNHALRGGLEGKQVPEELQDRLRRYHEGFDYTVKGVKNGKNVALMEELELTDYFMERFGVVGTADEVAERLHSLEPLGVRQVHVRVSRLEDLELLGEQVMPSLA